MSDPKKLNDLKKRIAEKDRELNEAINERAYEIAGATTGALTLRADIDLALEDWYFRSVNPFPDEYDPKGRIRGVYRELKILDKELENEEKKR